MQLDPQVFLDMAEQCNKLAFVDIESTGLKGDYNSVLVISVKPYKGHAIALACEEPGNDKNLVSCVGDVLNEFVCIVTYYGKGFDIPMLNTRRLSWGLDPLPPMHHIDMYYVLKSKLLTGRRSQGHLLEWLDTPEKKMSVSASDWNKVLDSKTRQLAMQTMVKRCVSDTKGLEHLYKRTRHLIGDIKRG